MKIVDSKIPLNYKTVRITKSRISKGLLAIPVSLLDYFPNKKTKLQVETRLGKRVTTKNFTPYSSSSRECRIGGMRSFYEEFQIKEGDEIVIQILDDFRYRILPENEFLETIRILEENFDKSQSENEAVDQLNRVSRVTGAKLKDIMLNEYHRLSAKPIEKRRYKKNSLTKRKVNVPVSIRKLLEEVYQGKCQLTDFTFINMNGKPYFEIHHIKPDLGHHLKNLLVVSPNIHAQFTHASVINHFDEDGWLRRVKLNKEKFAVNHLIDKLPKKFKKEIHFEF